MDDNAPDPVSLDERDRTILSALAGGMSRQDVVATLHVSEMTLGRIRMRAMDITGAPNITAALVRLAVSGQISAAGKPVKALPELLPGDSLLRKALYAKMVSCVNWLELADLRKAWDRAERWNW